MKNTFISFLFLSVISYSVNAQTAAEQLADKIAVKMKDSLSLSSEQKGQLYTINIQLSNQKASVRQQYAGTDSLQLKMQRVENTRDSLYRSVLGEEKYLLYRQKKRNLVNNN
jgi:hypothetical protein